MLRPLCDSNCTTLQVIAVEEDLIHAVMGPEADQSEDGIPLNTTPRYSNSHGLPADLLSGVGPSMRDRAMSDAKGRAARFRYAVPQSLTSLGNGGVVSGLRCNDSGLLRKRNVQN